jgi:hypothetical protein
MPVYQHVKKLNKTGGLLSTSLGSYQQIEGWLLVNRLYGWTLIRVC